MTIPLLNYSVRTQNQRVAGYEVPGDENPWIYSTDNLLSGAEIDDLIAAAYRQVYNEQQMIASNRQTSLESQLKCGQITVRDFMRGLVLSEPFRRHNYEANNNYRFVQMCIQRLLGREVYSDREKLAWSTVLATKGLQGFVDDLLYGDEYMSNFGDNIVPYQRRRILPQHTSGDLPFARMPRYGEDHRKQLEAMGYFQGKGIRQYLWAWQRQPYPKPVRSIGTALGYVGGSLVTLFLITVALTAFGIVSP